MVAQLQVGSSDGKHHGIGHEHARRVELRAFVAIVHIGRIDLVQAVAAILPVGLEECEQVGILRLAVPQLGVHEVDVAGLHDVLRAEVGYGIHHQTLVGVGLLHGVDERGEAVGEFHLLSLGVVAFATVAQLVDVEAVEAELRIDIVVALAEVVLPVGIGWVHEPDVALPSGRHLQDVLRVTVVARIESPCVAHAVVMPVFVGSVAEVVEHALHATSVQLCDIVFDDAGLYGAVGNVGVVVEQFGSRTAQRPVVLHLPVVELYAVDVAAVQEAHLRGYHVRGLCLVVGAHETIARITPPVGGHIDGNGAVDGLLVVARRGIDVDEVARVVGLRSRPCPRGVPVEIVFAGDLKAISVAHLGSRRHVAFHRECHRFARCIERLVGGEFQREVGFHRGGVFGVG